MEKRFILFIALSVGVFLAFMVADVLFKQWRGPAPNQQVAQNDGEADAEADVADGEADGGDKADGEAADGGKNDGDSSPEADGQAAPPQPEKPDNAEPPEGPAKPKQPLGTDTPELISRGSLNPESRFSALYTFNTRGAALERVELNDPKFKDLQDESGYFGHLGLTDVEDEGGCLVNVVGDGTPAHKAGIQKGDVIVALQDQPISGVNALNSALKKTRPRQKVKFTLERTKSPGGVERKTVEVALIRRPLEVIRPEPVDHDHTQPLDVNTSDDALSLLLTLGGKVQTKTKNGKEKSEFQLLDRLRYANWKAEVKEDAGDPVVEFSLGAEEGLDDAVLREIGVSGKLRIIKRFRLAKTSPEDLAKKTYGGRKAYHATIEIELVNEGDQPIKGLQYVFDGPNGLPTEGWWYSYKVGPAMFAAAGARDVIYQTEALAQSYYTKYDFVTCYNIWNQANTNDEPDVKFVPADMADARKLNYIGVDSQYFSAVLIPGTLEKRGETFDRLELAPVDTQLPDKLHAKLTNVSFAITSRPIELAPGETHAAKFVLFAGPKQPDLIAAYQLNDFIYYGWFGIVSQPLTHVLHFFHDHVVFNYGLAILLLTVLVRGCMFPISRKAVRNAQMMSALAPEMKSIAEKYKNDMEKRGKAQQELFRKYNYNPFGGCLLMFFQLPIFLGLYRALCVDLELRGAPLIPGLSWCGNLAAPDMLFRWEGLWSTLTATTGYLGPYFNLLPLFTVALFVVQQRMFTPPPTDDTQKMQQNMMMFMTLFMGVMFFRVPAGLCVYFITSSLWGVAERKLFPKPKLPAELERKMAEAKNKPEGEVAVAKPGGNGAAERAWRKKEKGRK